MTRLEAEIRDKLEQYLKGEMALRDFTEWFDVMSFPIGKPGHCQNLVNLVNGINLALYEYHTLVDSEFLDNRLKGVLAEPRTPDFGLE